MYCKSVCLKGGSVSLQISWPRAQCRWPSGRKPDQGRECEHRGDGHGDRIGDGDRSSGGRHKCQDPPRGSGDLWQRGGHGQRLHHLQHQPVVHARSLALVALLATGEPLRLLRPGRDGFLLAAHPQQRQPRDRDNQHLYTRHCGGASAEQSATDSGELWVSRGDSAAQRGLQEAIWGRGGVTHYQDNKRVALRRRLKEKHCHQRWETNFLISPRLLPSDHSIQTDRRPN